MSDLMIMENWVKDIKDWPKESFDELIGAIVRYGIFGEDCEEELSDVYVKSTYRNLRKQIDNMQTAYQEKVEYGKRSGRKGTYDQSQRERIAELAGEGLSVKEIAAKMGITDAKKIRAIYNTDEWKNRFRF